MIRLLAGLTVLAAVSSAAEVYRVAGVVVDATTNRPLPRARVLLTQTTTPDVVGSLITGDDGRFSFDVPLGKFRLLAGNRTFSTMLGSRAPDSPVGAAVVTGPGLDTAKLTLRWYPPAAISGRVVDQQGEAVESAIVQLLTSRVTGGRRVVSSFRFARTDDQGYYRFPVGGGTYYLVVSGEPWQERYRYDPTDNAPSFAYAPVYSGNGRDAAHATPILVRPGEEARADFTVVAVPGAILTVTHDGLADTRGSASLLIEGVGGSDGYQRSERLYGGVTRFRGVPPGRYVLRLEGTAGGKSVGVSREIVVSGVETTVEVKLLPAATVSGRVDLQDPKAPRRGSVYARLIGGRSQQTMVRPDGSFSFPQVSTGKYRPAVGSTDGHFAAQIQVDGAELRDGEIDIREGQEITVRMVASAETGRIEGLVMEGERPVEGIMVVLAPAAETKDLLRYRGFQTDTDGSYDFRNVPAGDYLLFATAETAFEYANAEAIRPYRGTAKPVRVVAKGTASYRIGITPPPSK